MEEVQEIGFSEWFMIGFNAGWITDIVCNTHDGLPLKDYELEAFDNGESPCIPILRLWASDGEEETEI